MLEGLLDCGKWIQLTLMHRAYPRDVGKCFASSGKRIALVACPAFLELNGRSVAASEVEAYEVFMVLAAGDLAEQELADWLRRSCP